MSEAKRTCPAAPEDRERLRKMVSDLGEGRTVELTGIPRATLGRVLADLPVRAGTRVVLRQSLRELDGDGDAT